MSLTTAPLGIVVPAWNDALVLKATLTHLFALAHSRDVGVDVVVVDDGSTDDTAAVATGFGGSCRVISTEHRGVSSARNTGLAALNTEFVTMLDADDLFSPGFFADLWPLASRPGGTGIVQGLIRDWTPSNAVAAEAGALYSGARNPGGSVPEVPDAWDLGPAYRSVNLGAAIYRRDVFDVVGGFNEAYQRHEDYDWYLRAYDLRIPKENVDIVALLYRRRSDGLSSQEPVGDPTRARVHGEAIRRRRVGLAEIPPGFPTTAEYFGAPPRRGATQPQSST